MQISHRTRGQLFHGAYTYCTLSADLGPERWPCSQRVAVSVAWDAAIEPAASNEVSSMVAPNEAEKQSMRSN